MVKTALMLVPWELYNKEPMTYWPREFLEKASEPLRHLPQRWVPVLRQAQGDRMSRVLHRRSIP